MKKYLQKILKIFVWTIGSVFALLLLLIILIQIPLVQNFAKEKAVSYLEGKIKTKITIDNIGLEFPKKIILEGFYFEDQKKDTLLSGKRLALDISLFKLMDNTIEVNSAELEGISANINRDQNDIFNFDYILKAFASPKKVESDSVSMEFSIEKIDLNNIKLKYDDAITKTDAYVHLKHFDTQIKTFELDQMNFEIPNSKIDGLHLVLKQGLTKEKMTTETTPTSLENSLKLNLGNIDLSKIDIDYKNESQKLATSLSIKKANVKIERLDLYNQIVLIESLALSQTKGELTLGKSDPFNTKKESPSKEPNKWDIKIANTDFKQINFRFDNKNAALVKKGIDYNHLDIKNLNLEVENIKYNPLSISGNINSFKMKEQSGLEIQSLKTEFFYGRKNSFFKKLYLKTPQTELKDEIRIGYTSIESLAKNIGELSLNADLKKSKLGIKDILIFVPSLSNTKPFANDPNTILQINGSVTGKLKDLEFPSIEISGIGSTQLEASGKITGLPDINKAYFDLNIKDLKSGSKDLKDFLPKETIPNSIQMPRKFSAKGTFKGTISNFNTNMSLATTFGTAKIKASFDQRTRNQEKYDAILDLTNFDLGKLIKNDSIGKVTLKVNIKGKGFDPKTATASLNGTILKAYYNKYTYQNLKLKGNIKDGNFAATADAKDPNLSFNLVSSGSFKDKYPSGKIQLNVDIADLEKLNLHAGPMKIRGVLDANIQSADLDYLNGEISAHDISIANAKEQFKLDSINVTAAATAEKNSLILKSQLLDAEITGKYKLSKMAAVLSNSLSKYYDNKSFSKKIASEKQQFIFKIGVKDNPVLLKFIPELKSVEPINISGRYNSVNDSIVLNGSIPKLIYNENTISNAVLKIETKDDALVYNFVIDDIQNTQFQLPHTAIYGKVENSILDYTLELKDFKNVDKYLISGRLKSINGNSEIKLDSKNLLLNYESWKIASENLIRFGKNGLYASDFELSKDGNSLRIQSQSTKKNAPIAIELVNFNLKTLSNIIQKDDWELSGNINGKALVKNETKNPMFTSDLTIENFRFQNDTLGTIHIKVDNLIAKEYQAKISISGQDNQANLDGIYKTGDSSFDMNLNIEKLHLKSIQGFTLNQLSEGTGFLSGNFKINGNSSQPNMIGELQFNEVGFKANQLNAKFKSINDKISFTINTIAFDNFTIKDEKGNDLAINGKIDSKDFTNLGFDLAIDADNFRAVNSKTEDNDLYYGELYLDNHLQIKGDLNNPIIDGNIKINKDTKFTIVLPQSDPSIAEREGIVEFIDQDSKKQIETVVLDQISSNTAIKGIDASVNVEIDKEAELSIVIDKANGDFLKLKGEAQLNGGIDSSGKTTLTGRYELVEGSYEMNFSSIKRKFDIKKGSYILWTGEPTEADINITAVYKTEAAPIDLIIDQLESVSAEVRNTYKQQIPFETELNMKGELMKPSITFDIILPEGNNNVSTEIINATQAKLILLREQPDELNKQVFALLLLNRFIGQDPFSSETGGTTASSLARESASKILSQQLNNLAGDLINGVELNFDLNSSQDYTTGQLENKTDLSVGVSKKLLNDRLKVTVGSSFGLEGPQQVNENANNIAGDVSLDYELSKDGRYKVRAYRLNKYQVALQGEVVETGVAFIITLDYNTFKELFRKNKAQGQQKNKPNE